jgi:RHS repeat-associated protein
MTLKAVAWQAAYQPFGTNTGASGLFTQNLRFPGQCADSETSWYQNGFRDYNSSMGRYIENDPIGLAGGINTYSYVQENPLGLFDELGLDSLGGMGLSGDYGSIYSLTSSQFIQFIIDSNRRILKYTPDFYSVNLTYPIIPQLPFFGVGLTASINAFNGNFYWGPSFEIGYPSGFSATIMGSYLLSHEPAQVSDLDSFLDGGSWTVSGGEIVGASYSQTSTAGSIGFGFTITGIGIGGSYCHSTATWAQ